MADIDIIFDAESIRAFLAKRNSQTRRTRGLYAINVNSEPDRWTKPRFEDGAWHFFYTHMAGSLPVHCPYGGPGDRHWGRERFWKDSRDANVVIYDATPEWGKYKRAAEPLRSTFLDGGQPTRAECQQNLEGNRFWSRRSPIFMPKWACRIWLPVVDVRPVRLWNIDRNDAVAEGIEEHEGGYRIPFGGGSRELLSTDAPALYRERWDQLNAKCRYAWDKANWWVWRIEYGEPELRGEL